MPWDITQQGCRYRWSSSVGAQPDTVRAQPTTYDRTRLKGSEGSNVHDTLSACLGGRAGWDASTVQQGQIKKGQQYCEFRRNITLEPCGVRRVDITGSPYRNPNPSLSIYLFVYFSCYLSTGAARDTERSQKYCWLRLGVHWSFLTHHPQDATLPKMPPATGDTMRYNNN